MSLAGRVPVGVGVGGATAGASIIRIVVAGPHEKADDEYEEQDAGEGEDEDEDAAQVERRSVEASPVDAAEVEGVPMPMGGVRFARRSYMYATSTQQDQQQGQEKELFSKMISAQNRRVRSKDEHDDSRRYVQ